MNHSLSCAFIVLVFCALTMGCGESPSDNTGGAGGQAGTGDASVGAATSSRTSGARGSSSSGIPCVSRSREVACANATCEVMEDNCGNAYACGDPASPQCAKDAEGNPAAWYVFNGGPGQFAANVTSIDYADAGDIKVSFKNCQPDDVITVGFRGHLSIAVASGGYVECEMVITEGTLQAPIQLTGSVRRFYGPEEDLITDTAQYEITKAGNCSMRLRARAPTNMGGDAFRVENWGYMAASKYTPPMP